MKKSYSILSLSTIGYCPLPLPTITLTPTTPNLTLYVFCHPVEWFLAPFLSFRSKFNCSH
ncbi:hypothetical protein HanRHA438_Chr16g0760091 [Helianthus annuus]|nr:hypothetical protein HanIR_Chr16g0813281 [Helianthus annuus]KAJ0835853.1 hypothetical protein HanRHA438_Chr16g0760091 [Helianthus annuus]